MKKLLDIEINLKNNFEKQKILNKLSNKFGIEISKKPNKNSTKSILNFFDESYEDVLSIFLNTIRNPETYLIDSMKYHLKFLLNQLDYPFDYHTLRNGMVKFIFPNEEIFNKFNPYGLIITIINSFNERWMETIKELSIMNFGSNYLITKIDDISYDNLFEMKKHNINLVVFDEEKEKNFLSEYNVIGFTELITVHLPAQKSLWEKYI